MKKLKQKPIKSYEIINLRKNYAYIYIYLKLKNSETKKPLMLRK